VNVEQWGLIGVFLAGATPWLEAIAVVPVGILAGLNPWAVVAAAIVGNCLTIFLFAYLGSEIRTRWLARRIAHGKSGESKRFDRAQRFFDRFGIYGIALLGPAFIGTQFAAAVAVAAGVKPLKAATIISGATLFWATAVAIATLVATT
jgi:membrane protein YqaA with SNARE-associated domain